MVASASAIGPPAPGKPSISTPSRSARLRVGRNGAPEGIVKTRGARWAMRAFYAARGGRQAGLPDGRFRASSQGRAVRLHVVSSPYITTVQSRLQCLIGL